MPVDLKAKYADAPREPIAATNGDLKAKYDTASRETLRPGESWAFPIDEQHPEVNRFRLKTWADAGPKTMQRNLEAAGFEARQYDPEDPMRFSIRRLGEPWRVLDPRGTSGGEVLRDVWDVTPSWTGLGIGMVLGTRFGKRAGVPGRLGGAGAGAGVFETGKQKLAGMLGYAVDPEEAAGKIALESGAAVLGEGGAMALGRLAKSPLGQRALMGAGKLYRPLKRGVSKITGLRRQLGAPGAPAAPAREALSREAPEDEMAALAPDFVEPPETRAVRQEGIRDLLETARLTRELEQVSPEPTPGVLAPGTRRGFELSGSTEPRAKAPGEVPASGEPPLGVIEEAGEILERVETSPGEAGRVIERGATGPLTPEEFARRAAAEAVSRREWQGYPHPSGGPGPARAEIERDILESLRNPGRDIDDLREVIRRGLFDPVPEEQMGPYAAMIKAGVEPQDAQRIISEFELPGAGRHPGAPGAPPVGLTPPGLPRPPAAPPGGTGRPGEPSPLAKYPPGELERWQYAREERFGEPGARPRGGGGPAGAFPGVPAELAEAAQQSYEQLVADGIQPEHARRMTVLRWGSTQEPAAPAVASQAPIELLQASAGTGEMALEVERRKVRGWTELWVNGEGITSFHPSDLGILAIIERDLRHAAKYGYTAETERNLDRLLRDTGLRGAMLDEVLEKIRRLFRGPRGGGAGGSPIPASGEMGGRGAPPGGGMPLESFGPGEGLGRLPGGAQARPAGGSSPGPPGKPPVPPWGSQGPSGGPSGQPGHVPADPQSKLRTAARLFGRGIERAGAALEMPSRALKRGVEYAYERAPSGVGSRYALKLDREQAQATIQTMAEDILERAPQLSNDQGIVRAAQNAAREALNTIGRRLLRTQELRKIQESLQAIAKRLDQPSRGALVDLPELPTSGMVLMRSPEIGILELPFGFLGSAGTTLMATKGLELAGKGVRAFGLRLMRDATGRELNGILRTAPPAVAALFQPLAAKLQSPGAYRAGVWSLLHHPRVREWLTEVSPESDREGERIR